MKAVSRLFKIVTPDKGATWHVVDKATGKVVWTGKTFRNARTAHAAREYGYDWRTAQRMGNA